MPPRARPTASRSSPKAGAGARRNGNGANARRSAATAAKTAEPAAAETSAGRREQRRLQQLDLGRAQLLDAAEEVFGAKGYHDTTLREIAELAEYSVGSVYSFFENKDDLFLHVFLRRGDEFLPGLEAVGTGDAEPAEKLRAIVDFEVGFFRTHPHFGKLYVRAASSPLLGPERPAPDELAANFDAAMRIHAKVFEDGQRTGQLREGDPAVLARLLSGLIYSYQSLDPAVVGDGDGERLPLASLQAIIVGAFAAPSGSPGSR